MQRNPAAMWLLIVALALVFGLFGVDKFLSPIVWIGWMPTWMEGLLGLPRETWLQIVGTTEIALAILVLIPVRRLRQIATCICALHLLIIITLTGYNDIAIRDVGLLLSSLALLTLL